uniref:(California timema) hypothetical protein n=1 Tax=Timema californicum TaxID=61474 RepID=A0A7R9IW50_TIMCA|nr:unnamed protein product [Timema californicum]
MQTTKIIIMEYVCDETFKVVLFATAPKLEDLCCIIVQINPLEKHDISAKSTNCDQFRVNSYTPPPNYYYPCFLNLLSSPPHLRRDLGTTI